MPLYTFRCQDCQSTFEELLRRVGDDPGICPKCGSADLARQFAPFAVGSSAANGADLACEPSAGCDAGACQASGGCPLN